MKKFPSNPAASFQVFVKLNLSSIVGYRSYLYLESSLSLLCNAETKILLLEHNFKFSYRQFVTHTGL
jgi:hypothetical protein